MPGDSPRSPLIRSIRSSVRPVAADAYRRATLIRARAARPLLVRSYERSRRQELDPGTVLFWIPEAGVGPHLAALEVMARVVVERGDPVVFTRCHALFGRCPVMDMYQIPEDSDTEPGATCCDRCLYNSVTMLRRYGLDALSLEPFARDVAPRLQEATSSRPPALRAFEYDGVPFGELAVHDLMLANKLVDIETVPEDLREGWWRRIVGCVHAYLLAGAVCSTGAVRTMVTFNDIGPQASARIAAEKLGIPVRSAAVASHRGVDRRRLVITDTVAHDAIPRHATEWPRWKDLALPPSTIGEAAGDVVDRFMNTGTSSHMFSSRISSSASVISGQLGLDRSKRTLVAYTSSLDEELAGRTYRRALGIESRDPDGPFPDQLSWLGALMEAVADRHDHQLIIRIHPREDAHGRRSAHIDLLRAHLCSVPDNVRVVWPRDPVSSYDLSRTAHAVTVAWSSIGLELARSGVPVIALSRGPSLGLHPGGGTAWEPTPELYLRKLFALANEDPPIGQVVTAYRWYAFRYLGHTADLSDLIASPAARNLPRWSTPQAADQIADAVLGIRSIASSNLERLRAGQREDSPRIEERSIRLQLGRLFTVLATHHNPGGAALIPTGREPDPRSGPLDPSAVDVEGDVVHLRSDKDGTRTYWSPMEARLIRISRDSGGRMPVGGR